VDESAALARDEDEHLQEKEQQHCATLRAFKRRAEFCAGRIAAKRALAQAPLCISASAFELERDAMGAPRLRALVPNPSRASITGVEENVEHQLIAARTHVSISHSHGFAVAVAAPWRIGVDLEAVEPRPNALVRYFYCVAEQRVLHQLQGSALQGAVHRFWTRKESACKLSGRGARLALRDIDASRHQVHVDEHVIQWRSAVFAGFAASIAFTPDDS